MFLASIRLRAQGVTLPVVCVGPSIRSLTVPALAANDFTTLTRVLTGFLAASGVIGYIGIEQPRHVSGETGDRASGGLKSRPSSNC